MAALWAQVKKAGSDIPTPPLRDEDGGEGEEFVAAAAVDVQVGVEEAVLV